MSSLCRFSYPRRAFKTLKNYYRLFKVTQLFSVSTLSTTLSLSGCRAGPSFPLLKHVCLYLLLGISAVLHSRRVTYGKHCLPHNTALSWADVSVRCIARVSWTQRGITCSWGHSVSFIAEIERFTSPFFPPLFLVWIIWTSLLSVFCLFNPSCALSCDLWIHPSH